MKHILLACKDEIRDFKKNPSLAADAGGCVSRPQGTVVLGDTGRNRQEGLSPWTVVLPQGIQSTSCQTVLHNGRCSSRAGPAGLNPSCSVSGPFSQQGMGLHL